MKLKDCEKGRNLSVVEVKVLDHKLKLRLYEIGFFKSSKIQLLNTSFSNKTMLVQVLDSCFAIKSDVADLIEVEYV